MPINIRLKVGFFDSRHATDFGNADLARGDQALNRALTNTQPFGGVVNGYQASAHLPSLLRWRFWQRHPVGRAAVIAFGPFITARTFPFAVFTRDKWEIRKLRPPQEHPFLLRRRFNWLPVHPSLLRADGVFAARFYASFKLRHQVSYGIG